jgi:hypothetical protein
MQTLLSAIRTQAPILLDYLQGCEVFEDETSLPMSCKFPYLGLLDGGITLESKPGKKDIQVLTVGFVAYQSIIINQPGASLMGHATLGDRGKGLFAIGADLKAAFNDNFLGLNFYWAHMDTQHPALTLLDDNLKVWVQFKRCDFTYRRYI